MSEPEQSPYDWNAATEQWNEQFLEAFEGSLEAQAEFVDQWAETIDDSTDDAELAAGVEGYARAYETWMDASQQMVEQVTETIDDDADLDLEEFRDVWLETANEAFSEVMSTAAFAELTGETVEETLELQRQADEAAESTLRSLGFATESDVLEVGDRLVELERRQHEVENKLDRILDHLEEE